MGALLLAGMLVALFAGLALGTSVRAAAGGCGRYGSPATCGAGHERNLDHGRHGRHNGAFRERDHFPKAEEEEEAPGASPVAALAQTPPRVSPPVFGPAPLLPSIIATVAPPVVIAVLTPLLSGGAANAFSVLTTNPALMLLILPNVVLAAAAGLTLARRLHP